MASTELRPHFAAAAPPRPPTLPRPAQAFPLPLFGGTLVYIAIAIALGFLGRWLLSSKRLTKDEAQIYCTTVVRARRPGRLRSGARGGCSAARRAPCPSRGLSRQPRAPAAHDG